MWRIDGNFTWDQQHNENTGKWRLFDLSMERPHECYEVKVEEASLETTTQSPRVKCPQCDPLKDTAWIAAGKASAPHKDSTFRFLVAFTPRFGTKNSLFW